MTGFCVNRFRLLKGLLVATGLVLLVGRGPEVFGQTDTGKSVSTNDAQTSKKTEPSGPPVESWMLTEPKTPQKLFDTVVLMVDFARLDLAKKYLKQLLAANPSDEEILKMREKHGPTKFFQLSQIKELQPESLQLLKRMNEAFKRAATDPKHLDALVEKLITGTPREQAEALVELKSVGAPSVARILWRLGQPGEQQHSALFVTTLTRFGPLAVPALLGGLEADNEHVKTAVIETLGYIGDLRAVPYLWHLAFGKDQTPDVVRAARVALARLLYKDPLRVEDVTAFGAVASLLKEAELHFREQYQWQELTENGDVELWEWNSEAQTIKRFQLAPREASWLIGARLAAEALRLAPENEQAQTLYLAFRLLGDARRVGWGNPLPTGPNSAYELALLCGSKTVLNVLRLALNDSQPACAVAALQVLSHIAPRSILYQQQAEQTPVLTALNCPDRRVQFAAACTVLELDPDKPFSGARRVVQILARALDSNRQPYALTIDPNAQRASTIAGLVQEAGYQPLVAATGKTGFKLAVERGDVELIVIHENVVDWELSDTVANLRADARTAGIPIVIYGPDPHRGPIERLLHLYPLMSYVVETTSSTDFKNQLQPFLLRLSSPPLSVRERAVVREKAAFWLAHIADGRRTDIFDITPAETALTRAVLMPEVAQKALIALGAIPTVSAQQLLSDVAVNEAMNSQTRVLAALQLGFHIQRFGLLLKPEQVETVREQWRKTNNADLKTALAAVLGTLKPNSVEVGRRLLQFDTARRPGE